MASKTPQHNCQREQTDTGVLKLPPLSAERKGTLEFMQARIDAFAEHLSSAQTIFSETQKRQPGSPEAKAAIHTAKQHVENALHELDSTLLLVNLNPDQVTHIAAHLYRALQRLSRIKAVSERVLRTEWTSHHSRALDALALACPRASRELEVTLVEPLKQTLRAQSEVGRQQPPTLTS
jgi:hypothetical protein